MGGVWYGDQLEGNPHDLQHVCKEELIALGSDGSGLVEDSLMAEDSDPAFARVAKLNILPLFSELQDLLRVKMVLSTKTGFVFVNP